MSETAKQYEKLVPLMPYINPGYWDELVNLRRVNAMQLITYGTPEPARSKFLSCFGLGRVVLGWGSPQAH